MSNQENGAVNQFGRALLGLFKFILRLLFVLLLAVALGAGIFFGISRGLPALERSYVQPVRDNAAAITALEARATQSAEQTGAQITALQERITALEVQNDSAENTLAEIQSQLETLNPLLDDQAALAARLDELDAAIAGLDEALAAIESENAAEISALESGIDENAAALEALAEEIAANDFPVAQAYADLQLVKVMALLTRAQVFVFQENAGLAQTDVESARDLLLSLAEDPAFAAFNLSPILTRIDLALESLPGQPDRAANDLEAAWDLLLEGAAGEALAGGETDSGAESDSPTPTPAATPTPTATPTP